MKKTRRAAEKTIRILGEADSDIRVEGKRQKGNISSHGFCRWRSKCGGMGIKEVQRQREP